MENEYNYDDFQDNQDEYVKETYTNHNNSYTNNNGKKKIYIIIGLGILLLIGLIVLLFNLFGNREKSVIFEITERMDLYVGDTKKVDITLKRIDEKNPKIVYMSQDESLATVSQDGLVKAISDGSVNIIVAYYDKDENVYSKNCLVSIMKKNQGNSDTSNIEKPIENPGNIDETALNLNYSVPNATASGWYRSNIAVQVNYNKSVLKSLKYTINCNSNCKYIDITGKNRFEVSNNGVNNITIIGISKDNKETVKKVTVKIDKEAPVVKLNKGNVIYDNTGKVSVCATCTDSLSGCKTEKICANHNESVDSAYLIATDKVGNNALSESYRVIIDKIKPTCSLTCKNNKITANVNDQGNSGLEYYGFSNTYSGKNETEKSGVTKGTYTYYVKDRAGNKNSCSTTCN